MTTLTAPAPTATHWSCTPCGLRSTGLNCPDEARILASTHDWLIHNQVQTATVEATR